MPSLVLISLIAVIAVSGMRSVIPFEPTVSQPEKATGARLTDLWKSLRKEGVMGAPPPVASPQAPNAPFWWSNPLTWVYVTLAEPMRVMLQPGREMAYKLAATVNFLWALLVWLVCGGAVSHGVGLHLARYDRPVLGESIASGLGRWQTGLTSLSIPLLGAAGLAVICTVCGLPGLVPLLGNLGLWAASPFIFVSGLAGAFLLAFSGAGWPFMVAAANIERDDGFNVLSRIFNYLTSGLTRWLGWLVLSVIPGLVLLTMLETWFSAAFQFVQWSLAWGLSDEGVARVAGILSGWPATVSRAFGAAYFWVTITWIYLMLRDYVDHLPIDQMAAGEEVPEPNPYPVVGIQAIEKHQ